MLTDQSINWQGKMLGRYRLLLLLGRGTMGEVWKAEDSQLGRQVAIKLLPKVLTKNTSLLEAFTNEVHTIVALEHPHILPIYDFGKAQTTPDEITPYVVMRLINEGSLSQRIRNTSGLLPIDECLYYLRQAAHAIDYAHSRQVFHRDIKPDNMLLQEQWLFLTDFGLAKLLTSATYHSQTQTGAGTAEYMAPEQAQGKTVAASDCYSLAVLAYQLFTGKLPFRGETPYATMMMHITNPLPPARRLNATIPPKVEETLTRSLAKHPEERHTSCLAFVDALEQGWQTRHQPTLDPDATLLAPWSKRTYEGVPQLSFPEPSYPYQPARQQADEQRTPLPQVPVTPLPYTQSGSAIPSLSTQNTPEYQQNMATFRSAPLYQDPTVLPLLNAQNISGTQQNMTTFQFHSTHLAPTILAPQAEISGTTKEKQPVIGRRAIVVGGTVAAVAVIGGGALALPKFLSRSTPAPVAKMVPGPHKLIPGIPLLALTGHTDAVRSVVWNPDGKHLATGSIDTRVMLWDIESFIKKKPNGFQTISTPMKTWKFANPIYENHMNWSHNGQILGVTDLTTTRIHLLDAFSKDNTIVEYVDATQANSFSFVYYDYIAMSPIDNTFVTGISEENKLVFWQQNNMTAPIKTLQYNQPYKDIPAGIEHLGWSSDGRFVAGTPENFVIVVWQVKTGKVVQEISMPERTKQHTIMLERSDLKYSPNDPYKVAATDIDIVTVYDTQHNKLLLSLGTDDKDALTMPANNTVGWVPQLGGTSWSPNGRYIAGTYGRSNKIYIWDTQEKNPNKTKDGLQIQSLLFGANNGHNQATIDIAWSPDGRYIATASFDQTVIIWKVDEN